MDIDAVYQQYFTDVYRYLLSISRDTHIAEELTQETFFKALQKAGDFRGDCELRVWLCQIARNAYYDYLRKNRKYAREESAEEEAEQTKDLMGDLVETLTDQKTAFALHQILHRLSEPYKEVFSLRVFGELPFPVIASLFGKSDSWARVTYHRACKKIKEEFKHEDQL